MLKTDNRTSAVGPRVFRIQGEMYHLQGPLQVPDDTVPHYAQAYFLGPEAAAQTRGQKLPDLNGTVLLDLSHMIEAVNSHIAQ